jgi:hypothetical protein
MSAVLDALKGAKGWDNPPPDARAAIAALNADDPAPPEARWKRIDLHFGAAGEESRVYVDGKPVLDHTVAGSGIALRRIWKEPFSVEVSDRFRDGAEHPIAADEPMNADQLWHMHKREIGTNDWLQERAPE